MIWLLLLAVPLVGVGLATYGLGFTRGRRERPHHAQRVTIAPTHLDTEGLHIDVDAPTSLARDTAIDLGLVKP